MASTACVGPHAKVSEVAVPAPTVQSAIRFHKEYVLFPGDQIEIQVRGVPQASRVVAIRPDGYISLPLLQDFKAEGMTARELAEKLTTALSARLINPEVTVIPTVVRQPMVYVVGEVITPSAVPYQMAPTAMQAISSVGGFRRTASQRNITVIRLTEDGYLRAIPVSAPVKGQPGPVMALRTAVLQPDDIIFVPENGRAQVNRFYDDVFSRPMLAVNQVLGTYLNFRLVETVTKP